jgi:transposase
MTAIKLSPRDYQRVVETTQWAENAKVLKRAQGLLWLADGERVDEVAERLQVSVRTLYRWIERFEARASYSIEERLTDALRSGRPARIGERIEPLMAGLLADTPEDHGYNAGVWTAPLLREHLHKHHQLGVSRRSVSRALARLRLRWKRPRHSLARRSPTWRQEKGG